MLVTRRLLAEGGGQSNSSIVIYTLRKVGRWVVVYAKLLYHYTYEAGGAKCSTSSVLSDCKSRQQCRLYPFLMSLTDSNNGSLPATFVTRSCHGDNELGQPLLIRISAKHEFPLGSKLCARIHSSGCRTEFV